MMCVCASVCHLPAFSSGSTWSLVLWYGASYGQYPDPFFSNFQIFHFWPIYREKKVKIDPKTDIFTKSYGVFFWQRAYTFWGLKYVYWGYFKGYAKYGAKIRIFSARNWT